MFQQNLTLKEFFQIPVVRFGIHLILLLGFFSNITYFYLSWNLEIQTKKVGEEITQTEDYLDQKAYYESDLYKEKFVKNQSFQIPSETIIDTSTIEETTENKNIKYEPESELNQKTNPEKWFNCYFKSSKNNCL